MLIYIQSDANSIEPKRKIIRAISNCAKAVIVNGLKNYESLKVLGSFVSLDSYGQIENYKNIINKVNKTVAKYSTILTTNIPARVFVWNVLVLPKITHLLRTTTYCRKLIKKVQEIAFKFIFKYGKSRLITMKRVTLPKKYGGLGMIDIESFWKTITFSWFKKILRPRTIWAELLNSKLIEQYGFSIDEVYGKGPDKIINTLQNMNIFWKNVLR
ncbi:Hypothetical protein FKW44_023102 [Caligus rogercresseyi]|uniref:Uncharacterized protein n=1 Tax=Caligus rogercresseyi TaxID=217165 RepID=A0A7T8JTX2_CALRO|nr:Hypothetical protein FKW44_023102 [Caligus rogercresseyi]